MLAWTSRKHCGKQVCWSERSHLLLLPHALGSCRQRGSTAATARSSPGAGAGAARAAAADRRHAGQAGGAGVRGYFLRRDGGATRARQLPATAGWTCPCWLWRRPSRPCTRPRAVARASRVPGASWPAAVVSDRMTQLPAGATGGGGVYQGMARQGPAARGELHGGADSRALQRPPQRRLPLAGGARRPGRPLPPLPGVRPAGWMCACRSKHCVQGGGAA